MPLGANSRMKASLDVVGVDLAVHMRLAHAARDQLRDLRAEVEDQDLVVHGRASQVAALPAAAVARHAALARGSGAARSASPQPAARRRSRTARRCASRPAAGATPAPAAARRSPAPAPPSGCSATPPRPSSGPASSASAALETMLCIAAVHGEAEQVDDDHRVHHPALGGQRPTAEVATASTRPARSPPGAAARSA